jgi:adenylate cyclase
MSDSHLTRRLAAIMAADVAGYSRALAADEDKTLTALKQLWDGLFNPLVAMHRGRIVKMLGDGALVEFQSAVDAVACAVAVQKAIDSAAENAGWLLLRIGVNLGETVIDDGDIFGDGVNVAARLESQAPVGGLLISDLVHAQVKGKTPVEFTRAGRIKLKNIAHPVDVWCWSETAETPRFAPAPIADKPTIIIFPFANLSKDSDQDAFADGLTEDILATLSKIAGLSVIARDTAFAYKSSDVDYLQIAQEIGAQYLLSGSVRKQGERIRISAQLTDVVNRRQVWAERYDRTLDDIFAVQDEITLILATEMQVELTEGDQARLRYTTTSNVEAWTWWIRGLSHHRSGVVAKDRLGRARDCWEKALALDPQSASLNAMLAFVHAGMARLAWVDTEETLRTAEALVSRALELDQENADAHMVDGLLLTQRRRHDEAAAASRRAVELAPGSADCAAFAASVLARADFGDEAVVEIERTLRLSPICPANYFGIKGLAYRIAGRLDEALAAFKDYAERSPGFAHADMAILYQLTGRPDRARAEVALHLAARPGATVGGWKGTQFRRNAAKLEEDLAALRAAGLPD